MEKYVDQLLQDIEAAIEIAKTPTESRSYEIWEWLSEEEEDRTAPVRELEDLTGIKQEQLPPSSLLADDQITKLTKALIDLLNTHNWSFVMQTEVPEKFQYECIRQNFKQTVKVYKWKMGFFENCKPGTEHHTCALKEYCQCAFFAELFAGFIDIEQTPEEEREMMLQMEIKQLKRKYGPDWHRYYPYHLDKNFDDEDGNEYGFGDDDGDDEDDNWWRK